MQAEFRCSGVLDFLIPPSITFWVIMMREDPGGSRTDKKHTKASRNSPECWPEPLFQGEVSVTETELELVGSSHFSSLIFFIILLHKNILSLFTYFKKESHMEIGEDFLTQFTCTGRVLPGLHRCFWSLGCKDLPRTVCRKCFYNDYQYGDLGL